MQVEEVTFSSLWRDIAPVPRQMLRAVISATVAYLGPFGVAAAVGFWRASLLAPVNLLVFVGSLSLFNVVARSARVARIGSAAAAAVGIVILAVAAATMASSNDVLHLVVLALCIGALAWVNQYVFCNLLRLEQNA